MKFLINLNCKNKYLIDKNYIIKNVEIFKKYTCKDLYLYKKGQTAYIYDITIVLGFYINVLSINLYRLNSTSYYNKLYNIFIKNGNKLNILKTFFKIYYVFFNNLLNTSSNQYLNFSYYNNFMFNYNTYY